MANLLAVLFHYFHVVVCVVTVAAVTVYIQHACVQVCCNVNILKLLFITIIVIQITQNALYRLTLSQSPQL